MFPVEASAIYIVEGIEEDSLTSARARRLESQIRSKTIQHIDDAELNEIVIKNELNSPKSHGIKAEINPIIIFNRFRFDDPPELVEERKHKFPALFVNSGHKFNGYGGFDWYDAGSPAYREKTGIICQSSWKLHTICGCPFLCAYCFFGHFINIMMNVEDFVDRLDTYIEKAPGQTLYQYDNYTDTTCFEPEYGGVKQLVEYFAKRQREYLEVYVGKNHNIDFMLDIDHKGHTVCCWSLSGQTQSTEIEYKTASMNERISAAKKCQEAGYHVRFRLSPIIPVRNWKAENRQMIESLFTDVRPDVITFETLRFRDYDAIVKEIDPSLLDPEFLKVMEESQGNRHLTGCEIPDDYRKKVYEFIINELERVSYETPYAFCRESRIIWEGFADRLVQHDQSIDRYVCNCGPDSAPGHELLCSRSFS